MAERDAGSGRGGSGRGGNGRGDSVRAGGSDRTGGNGGNRGATEQVTPALLRQWPLPGPGGDKESRGRVLVVGGTASTPGAVLLAGEAVLRSGGGKLQVATAHEVAAALAVAVPEALVHPLPTDGGGSLAAEAADELRELADGADAVLVGSGFSDVEATLALLHALVPRLEAPLVLDAVASAYLGKGGGDVHDLAHGCVLSANVDEVALTLGVPTQEVGQDPAGAAAALASRSGAVVLCGGSTKTVAAPDGRVWWTDAGGPGLGVSGSGDVQAGIVAGLLGRGAEPEQAAVWGAFLHGRAGDELAGRVGTVGFLAREVPGAVPALLHELTSQD
ncbi:NAD(P)H-hydrate dehydratase [Phycicoccus sp. M110.8]|uniref:NAD(P)H-hydrate dehydratase n=1 Tax=Phycicoccus sp. M110.8 TaxID=3075433 RepID=UPI0028FD879A|nr:NAD(P)H-hydrate dehydratase [Phycicoccus sp. M110.8]MDU0313472.1 NAD(P)H-hydrate dehydratase [Phycicoccus sp. M110.8]